MREQTEAVPRGSNLAIAFRLDFKQFAFLGRQLELLLERPGSVAQESHLDLLPHLSAGRINGCRTREDAHVEAISATAVTAISGLTNLDDVTTVGGSHGRDHRILEDQRRVISAGQLESLGVKDGDIGIKQRRCQPHPFDLGGDPLALLGLDDVIVDVLAVHHSGDSDVQRNRLRCRKIAVGFLLGGRSKGTDPEGLVFTDTTGCPHLGHMLPQSAVGQHLDGRLDLAGSRLELHDFETGAVEEDLLGVLQPSATEDHLVLDPALNPAGVDPTKRRRSRLDGQSHRQSQQQGTRHSSVQSLHLESLRFGEAVAIPATPLNVSRRPKLHPNAAGGEGVVGNWKKKPQ